MEETNGLFLVATVAQNAAVNVVDLVALEWGLQGTTDLVRARRGQAAR